MSSSYGRGGGYGGENGYQSSSSGGSSSQDFDRLVASVSSNIQKITQNTSRCQRMVDQIGTAQDTNNLTNQIQQIQHTNNELAKTTNIQLRNLAEAVRGSPANLKRQREMQKGRLTDEFTSVLNKVQKIQREAADKERASVRRARAHSATSSNPFADTDEYGAGYSSNLVSIEGSASPKQSMQAVIEEEDNLAAIQEREAAIKNLESDIMDVNQIFKDLGALVYEQGEMIDSIESNVENAAVHVEQGNVQLQSAAKYQSAARRKKCICFIILAVAAVVLVCVVVIPIVVKTQANKNN